MRKGIKYALFFTGGVAVGIGVCEVITRNVIDAIIKSITNSIITKLYLTQEHPQKKQKKRWKRLSMNMAM